MTTLKVGIASFKEMKARTMTIARGEYKPRRGEPKVWFTSLESFARVLSVRNRALLNLIAEAQPESIAELASLSGRAKSNLSRTLRTMEGYGLVRLKRGERGKLAPRVPYTEIVLDVPIGEGKVASGDGA
jgi:predicted transcriptional regulator